MASIATIQMIQIACKTRIYSHKIRYTNVILSDAGKSAASHEGGAGGRATGVSPSNSRREVCPQGASEDGGEGGDPSGLHGNRSRTLRSKPMAPSLSEEGVDCGAAPMGPWWIVPPKDCNLCSCNMV